MKHVITGPPCSGKSTLLEMLSKLGFSCVPEAARSVISGEQYLERSDPNYRGTLPWYPDMFEEFQRRVCEVQQAFEFFAEEKAKESKIETIFLDRSMVDQVAYCTLGKCNEPPNLRELMWQAQYGTVFYCEAVPYTVDDQRKETPEEAQRVDEALRIAYSDFGRPMVYLTGCPVTRVDTVLNVLIEIAKP